MGVNDRDECHKCLSKSANPVASLLVLTISISKIAMESNHASAQSMKGSALNRDRVGSLLKIFTKGLKHSQAFKNIVLLVLSTPHFLFQSHC
jgi:hypothetical protein